MIRRIKDAFTVLIAVAAAVVIVWAAFQLERYKARIWAEELRVLK